MPASSPNIRSIFDQALEIASAAERHAFLDEVCGGAPEVRAQVEALLAAHAAAGSFLESPPSAVVDVGPTLDRPLSERPGTQIGPYKLLQQIGEGGFGIVFMAEQVEPVRRRVALKVIKPGMDTRQVIARFEAERQALAVMDHPNIARVLDAGATESGRPYFVMELVRGTPITQYCDENNLPVRERLELFATVCQAIQHAHTKGIIHRDIKPTNVLVTRQDGQPVVKVIDFGIAKAMGHQLTDKTLFTDFAQMIGTPLYMSPEQAELSSNDIDTRSDIYSLGVLLYELLTGSTPVSKEQLKQAAFDEIRRIIREDEAERPSNRISTAEAAPSIAAQRHTEPAKLARLVRGELDWIVMKALEKDRSRRYETANGFAMDLQRYLADEPVDAGPPSAAYRLRKFVRRNKGPVAAVAMVVLALLGGIAGTSWGLIRAISAEAEAVAEGLAKGRALVHKDEALTQLEQEQTRTKAALLESQREAARLAFEQPYGDCMRDQVDRGFLAMAYCLPRAREAELPELEESIRLHLGGWGRELHPWRTIFPSSRGIANTQGRQQAAVAFDPQGRTMVVASTMEARSWDLETGKLLSEFKYRAKSVAISPDAKQVVTVSLSLLTTARVWEVATGKWVTTDLPHPARIDAVAFSPDSKSILTAAEDQTLRLWDVQAQKMTGTLINHSAPVTMATFSVDGRMVFTASNKRQLDPGNSKVLLEAEVLKWDAQTGKAIGPLVPDQRLPQVSCTALSPDGELAALGVIGNDALGQPERHYAQVWGIATGMPVGFPLVHQGEIEVIAFSPDCKRLLTAGRSKTAHLWDIESGTELAPPLQHRGAVRAIAFSPDGRSVLSSDGRDAYRWDLDTARDLVVSMRHEGVRHGAFSPDGRTIVTGGDDGVIRAWDATSGKPRGMPIPIGPGLGTLAVSPDGKAVATGSRGMHPAQLWDTTSGELLTQTIAGASPMTDVAFSNEAKTIVTGASDGTVQRWDSGSGKPLGPPRRDHPSCCTLAFSPDGRIVATGGTDQTARLWDSESGRSLGPALAHEAEVKSLWFSANSRFLTTFSDFQTRVWDVATGQLVSRPLNMVATGPPSPDGKTIGGLTETGTGKLLGMGPSPPTQVFSTVSPDGRKLLIGTVRDMAQVWKLGPVEGEPARIILWAQLLTGMELDEKGVPRDLDFETRRERRRQLDKLGGPPWP